MGDQTVRRGRHLFREHCRAQRTPWLIPAWRRGNPFGFWVKCRPSPGRRTDPELFLGFGAGRTAGPPESTHLARARSNSGRWPCPVPRPRRARSGRTGRSQTPAQSSRPRHRKRLGHPDTLAGPACQTHSGPHPVWTSNQTPLSPSIEKPHWSARVSTTNRP
jgi:hypothetical protein